jgi:hypothetical protein
MYRYESWVRLGIVVQYVFVLYNNYKIIIN